MNKSFATNLVSAMCIAAGAAAPEPYRIPVLTMGMFALSGALTNWAAIHMLFEKVPGLYGSGIVPLHFEDFKLGIRDLMMRQFFTHENIERLFNEEAATAAELDLDPLLDKADLKPAFEALIEAVMESPLGGMLGMMGGVQALEPLREPFQLKMRGAIKEIAASDDFKSAFKAGLPAAAITDDIIAKIDTVVTARLDELTPQAVKEIIQNMIREHLGWLVVWGGVFGGAIGLVAAFLTG
ncbi:MAG: DUF445 domain-containing protein [Verrucomicrobiia bacterium]|jgi:hypothetical protein